MKKKKSYTVLSSTAPIIPNLMPLVSPACSTYFLLDVNSVSDIKTEWDDECMFNLVSNILMCLCNEVYFLIDSIGYMNQQLGIATVLNLLS